MEKWKQLFVQLRAELFWKFHGGVKDFSKEATMFLAHDEVQNPSGIYISR